MTSKVPSRRLTDVLRSNSKETLLRNAAELAKVHASFSAEEIQTRFLRNQFLINPKSLRLLCEEDVLSRWSVFAVYKPPFCPMRRAEACENYHRVSVETFVEAALRSRTVQPILQRELRPEEMKVRVVNNVGTHASGPVVVTVADRHAFTTSLQEFTMHYDVLVAGHIPLTEPRPLATDVLFTSLRARNSSSSSNNSVSGGGTTETKVGGENRAMDAPCSPSTTTASDSGPSSPSSLSCVCTFQVRRNAYYAVHPVSLLQFTITAPPTTLPPSIDTFVRDHLGTFVLGDPAVADGAGVTKASWGVVAMRGDCDFPRVFLHLREVNINAELKDAADNVIGKKLLSFHCRNCIEPILQQERVYSLKGRRIGLLDGMWTPEAEFL